MPDDEETLFEFPCEFPIKVMGADEESLSALVRQVLENHAPQSADREFVIRPSSKGRFVAITATITATSKAQLDSIYQEFTDSELVLFSL